MNKEEILQQMDLAIRQDRERFFKVADTLHLQPKYKDRQDELETIKQEWRNVTDLTDYPNITHPLPLPDWFPSIHFASSFEKDVYLNEMLQEDEDAEKETSA